MQSCASARRGLSIGDEADILSKSVCIECQKDERPREALFVVLARNDVQGREAAILSERPLFFTYKCVWVCTPC